MCHIILAIDHPRIYSYYIKQYYTYSILGVLLSNLQCCHCVLFTYHWELAESLCRTFYELAAQLWKHSHFPLDETSVCLQHPTTNPNIKLTEFDICFTFVSSSPSFLWPWLTAKPGMHGMWNELWYTVIWSMLIWQVDSSLRKNEILKNIIYTTYFWHKLIKHKKHLIHNFYSKSPCQPFGGAFNLISGT